MQTLRSGSALLALAALSCSYPRIELPEPKRLEVRPYSEAAPRWNDYVLADDFDEPCPRATLDAACVHAGAWRELPVSDEAGCEDLTVHDEHDLFEWTCSVHDGEVVFVGRPKVGLVDMIDMDTLEWRRSGIKLERDDTVIGTAPSPHWENPIEEVPSPIGGLIELNEPGIYVARGELEADFKISADGVLLVDASGEATRSFEIEAGLSFLWIEGVHIDVTGAGIELVGLSDSVVQDIAVVRDEATAIATDDIDLRIDATASTIARLRSRGAMGTAISIEGNGNDVRDVEVVDAAGDGLLLQLADSTVSELRVAQAGRNCVLLQGTTGTKVENVSAADCNQDGVLVEADSHHDAFADVVASNNGGTGIVLRGSNHRVSQVLSASNTGSGVRVEGERTLIMHATAANNAWAGFQLGLVLNGGDYGPAGIEKSAIDTEIVNVVSTNNAYGMVFHFDSEGTRVHDAWIATNADGDLHIDANGNVFTGALAVSSNTSCHVNIVWRDELDNAGIDVGEDRECNNAGESSATISIGNALEPSAGARVLVAHQTASDSLNEPLVNDRRAHDMISDWVTFSHRYRHWGRPHDSGIFPNPDSLGRCDKESDCALWDWRVTHMDSLARDPLEQQAGGLRAVLDDAVHVRTHRWSASDAEACSAIDGATWNETDSECATRFVAYGYEARGDGHGNDNLLCEPGERCILNRNRGAYSGQDKLIDVGRVEIPGFGGFTLQMFTENGG